MRRRRGIVVVLVVTGLAGCASLTGAGEPAERSAIAARSEVLGMAPELVRTTTVDGYDLATQSVGVYGDDGMAAVFFRTGDGATVHLGTLRSADPTAVPCADLADTTETLLRCAVEDDGVHVVLEGDGADAADLRAAAEAVRVPTADELDDLFADVPTELPEPVERGDLPDGDGAPDNDPGLGG